MKLHLPVILRKAVLACLAAVGMTLMPGLPAYAGWSDQDADTFLYTGETTIDLTTSDVTQAYYLIRPGTAASANNDVSGVVELLNVGNGVEVKVSDGYYAGAQGKKFTTDFIINELRYAEGNGNNTFSIHNKQSATIKKFSGAPVDIKMYDAQELVLGGDAGTAHTVDIISFEANNNQNVYTRNLTIADGVSVTATKLMNPWGFGTLSVDGILNITDTTEGLFLSSGENASTQNNRITGSGVINTATLVCRNQGTYNFDIDELNVQGNAVFGGYGVHVHGGFIKLAGSTTMNTLVTLYDGASIQNNAESAIQFGSNFRLNIENLTAQVQSDRSRVYTILSGTGNKDLSALSLDNVSVSERYGWDWHFNQNGTIVASYKGRDISFEGGALLWNADAENQAFSLNGAATAFETDDNVTFLDDSIVELAEDISVTRFIVQDDATLSLKTVGHDIHVTNLAGEGYIKVNTTGDDVGNFTIQGQGDDFSGILSVKGNTTLRVSDSIMRNTSATIIIDDGATLETNWYLRDLFDLPNISTKGSGVIRLIGTDGVYLGSNTEIKRNYEHVGGSNYFLNGFWSDNKWNTFFRVGEGRSFKVEHNFAIESCVNLQIHGGTVQAGTMHLGHWNSNAGNYWGKLTMTDGNLTTGTISLKFNHTNGIDISGGNVEFTASQAINRENNTATLIRIVGASPQSCVNLRANESDWTLDGAGLNTKPIVGNITIEAGNTYNITLANVELTGSIVNNASLTLGEGISVLSGSTATLSGDTVEIVRTIANSGTLNLNTALVEVSQRNVEKLTVDLENAEAWYSADGSEHGASREGNGFRFLKNGKFYLATGGDVSIAQGAQVQLDNHRYGLFTDEIGIAFSASELTRSWEYYVNTGEITVGGDAATVGTDLAESFVVAQGSTLNLAGGTENHSVNDLLPLISGAGDVALKTNATLGGDVATVASGKLSIGSGVTLTLGNDQHKSASLASFSAVEINGGTIYYNNNSTTINNLTVKEGGATWTHEDQGTGLVTLAGTTTLEGDISFVDRWNGQYSMQKLTGNGNMSLSRATSDSNELWSFQIDDATGYTGTLSLTKAQVTLGSSLGAGARISVGEGASVTMNDIVQVTFRASSSLSSSSSAHGGAIYGSSNSTITLSNNGSVTFSGNMSSSCGGAIYTSGSLSIRNNESASFSRNAEVENGTYRLRSIYVGGSRNVISLSSAAGQSIEFQDSLYIGNGNTFNLNETYGETAQKGDILFTGTTTVVDLYEVKGNVAGTAEEILASRTTEVYTMTNLFGGRLRVEEGAIYKGYGITAYSDSEAAVVVKNAELQHNGYDLTFHAGTTLELAGNNTIIGNVQLQEASTLSFDGSSDMGVTRLTGNIAFSDGVEISLSKGGEWDGENVVLLCVNGSLSGWDEISQSIPNGENDCADISWVNGDLLVLNYNRDTFKPLFNGDSSFTTRQTGNVKLKYYDSIIFNALSYSGSGGAIHGDSNSTITLSDNGSVAFEGNSASGEYARGGAIYGGHIRLTGNSLVEFSRNSATSGAAILGTTIEFRDNENVKFIGNVSSAGDVAGIFNSENNAGTITFADNGSVIFRENIALIGVISGQSGEMSLNGNASVEFSDNQGTAIFAVNCNIALNGNDSVKFIRNAAQVIDSYHPSGAIYWTTAGIILEEYNHTVTLNNNKEVVFNGNQALSGAAICVSSPCVMTLDGNGSVSFVDNGAIDQGGAIDGWRVQVTLSNNESLEFKGNWVSGSSTPRGGAISIDAGVLNLQNNDSVVFHQNAEVLNGQYRLRGIYSSRSEVNLSAEEGKSILFRDSVYIGANGAFNINADYSDAEGNSIEQQGDIIFSGATTVNDLYLVKGNVAGTEEEIRLSRTTEVNTMTNLYGGRLRVEDGAIYQGQGIMVHEGSAATVLVKDATLNHDGFALTFNAGTTLQVEGESLIVGDVLMMAQSVLHLDGETTINGALTLGLGMQLAGDILAEVQNLQVGQSITLVSGLESLAVQTQSLMRSVEYTTVMDGYEVQASEYFANLAGNTGLVMRYDSEGGTVSITQTMAVPEPTTATLSLLALAALAVRRRRK